MSILVDKIFPISIEASATHFIDLSQLLAAYARDEIVDLPFLRAHQRSPWHSFCVQLAALALHRGQRDDIVDSAEEWRELLRGLTAAWLDDEPWRLVVEDVSKPAFMQPPVPKGTPDPHRTPIATPDDLDVLVTSKNHGGKQGIVGDGSPAAWVAALVLLQTTGGFLGAGNYGIARMNGGFATRPFVGLVPEGGVGAHWRRDVRVLLGQRRWFFERFANFREEDGAALLWCLPWDGKRSLGLDELDPWFIEVCRRVRLYQDEQGRISARSVGSEVSRVAAKAQKGNVGDPWVPIEIGRDSMAYNTTPTYRTMSDVLFDRDQWLRPLLLDWQDGIDRLPMRARFDVLVRGQGTTEGLHRREVRIDGEKRRDFFATGAGRDRLAGLSKEMIDHAGTLRNKVLKVALLTLVQAGDAEVDFRDKTASAWVLPWLDAAEQRVEGDFFDHLFKTAETDDFRPWVLFLRGTANSVLGWAIEAMPIAGVRRLKAVAVAEQKLAALFWKNFKGHLEEPAMEAVDVG